MFYSSLFVPYWNPSQHCKMLRRMPFPWFSWASFLSLLLFLLLLPLRLLAFCSSVLWRRHPKKPACRESRRALFCDVHKWPVYRLTLVLYPNKSSTDDYFVYPMAQEIFHYVENSNPRLPQVMISKIDTLNPPTGKGQRSALSMRTLAFSPENFRANNAHPTIKHPLALYDTRTPPL